MNDTEARWLRIKRYDDHDLDALHAKERDADLQHKENYSYGRYQEAGDGWLTAGVRFMDDLDRRLGAYWDKEKPLDERNLEIDRFKACPVVRKWFAKMDSTELSEQAFLAQADWEIKSKAYMPNTGKGSTETKSKLAKLGYVKTIRTPYDGSED
jgi:hypothetical protein